MTFSIHQLSLLSRCLKVAFFIEKEANEQVDHLMVSDDHPWILATQEKSRVRSRSFKKTRRYEDNGQQIILRQCITRSDIKSNTKSSFPYLSKHLPSLNATQTIEQLRNRHNVDQFNWKSFVRRRKVWTSTKIPHFRLNVGTSLIKLQSN